MLSGDDGRLHVTMTAEKMLSAICGRLTSAGGRFQMTADVVRCRQLPLSNLSGRFLILKAAFRI
jgi:hypothetical protein